MKKLAFTMLELVFVIVVIGILAAMVIPRLDRDNRFEAATQVLNHIKYTQHLAMTEDVYDDGVANWFLQRWEIEFDGAGCYSVHSDRDMDALPAENLEAAFDPQTRKRLWAPAGCAMPQAATDFEKMNLAGYFDVIGIVTNGCGGGGSAISFDTLGRPYDDTNTINGVIRQNCQITLNFNTGAPEIIRIHPETGYSCILDAAGANCL